MIKNLRKQIIFKTMRVKKNAQKEDYCFKSKNTKKSARKATSCLQTLKALTHLCLCCKP